MSVLFVPLLIGAAVAILLHSLFVVFIKVPKDFPPGPWLPLPILCILPFGRYWGMNRLAVFRDLRVRYGDLYTVHLGHKRIVMMTNLEQVQTVFARKINKRPEDSGWKDKQYLETFIF